MKQEGSRGPSLDIERCVRNAGGNKFDMILLAAARARELNRQNRYSENTRLPNSTVTSLLEIQESTSTVRR